MRIWIQSTVGDIRGDEELILIISISFSFPPPWWVTWEVITRPHALASGYAKISLSIPKFTFTTNSDYRCSLVPGRNWKSQITKFVGYQYQRTKINWKTTNVCFHRINNLRDLDPSINCFSGKFNKIKTRSVFLLLSFGAKWFCRVICILILFRSNSFQCPPFYGNSFQCPPLQANSSQCPPVSGLRELKIPVLDAIRNDSLLDQHLKKAKNS